MDYFSYHQNKLIKQEQLWLGEDKQLVHVTKLGVKGSLLSRLFLVTFSHCCKSPISHLSDSIPHTVPSKFPKCWFHPALCYSHSCSPILQKKKSKLHVQTPCSDPMYGNNRSYYFHSKHWVKFFFHNMSPSKLYCTLLSLCEVPFPSEMPKVLFMPNFLQVSLPQHLLVILCFGNSSLYWFKKRIYASIERPESLEFRDLCWNSSFTCNFT